MQVTILTQELKKGLGFTERLTGRNLTLPVLNNILIEASSNFLKISSTDLETGVQWWGLAKTEVEGKITVPAKILAQVVNSIPEEKVELENKNDTLIIKANKLEKDNFIEIESQILKQGLIDVVDIASQSQIRPEISGIYFVFKKELINLVATDSFRLVEKTCASKNYKTNFEEEISFIIPQKTVKEVINILDDSDKLVKVYFSESQVLFETNLGEVDHPEINLISRQIEGNYPEYKEIIPKDFKTKIIVDRDEFIKQIKLAGLFAGKINEVKFKVNEADFEILSQDIDLGENNSILKAKIEGEQTEVSFNYRFVLDGVSKIKEKEIQIELQGPSGAGVIKNIDSKDYIYVVMPIKK
jgi:DNA polymerase-3 subunit beta